LRRFFVLTGFFLCAVFSLANGCMPSYPKETLEQSLKQICKDEYGVDHVQVKTAGKTIGVYLPLDELFSTDIEGILASGKVKNIASFMQLSPKAMDKVEDVLFSTSRVILSTDKPLDFYILKAIDTESTGISLILVGYVPDIKRVRFWDIPRSEYRKRVLHDLQVNYVVIWQRPVVGLFRNLGKENTETLLEKYFLPGSRFETLSPLFYSLLLEAQYKENISCEILDLRATASRPNEAMVYAKVRETYTPKADAAGHEFILPSGAEAEYIFVLTKYLGDYKINRVIPFFYLAPDRSVKKVDFPPELKLYENLDKWQKEFDLNEIFLENFLAQQITRRVSNLLVEDERIQNTFSKRRVLFRFIYPEDEKKQKGFFSVETDLVLKNSPYLGNLDEDEEKDVNYLLDLALRECMTVLHGYHFEDYAYIKLESVFGTPFVMSKENLELYRKKKLPVEQLLEKSAVT